MTEHIGPTTAAAHNRRFRALVVDVDPDAIYRAVHEAGGIRSWEDPTRDLHYLQPNAIEVYQVGGGWVLAVNGPSADAVREGLRLLRVGADRDVQELEGAA
ncbi:hypothetical protein [Saccharopolyspora elongata]|uniref:Uncharacterized protein n=1 Tax=Saccharopolyspora elongata TaxID=2530387 RepID=A0A4R4Y8Q0_9PSEU|nr:hypothetical protein [Saccharopolyspora elongata]TDD40300.1 hypothetical protein E1288_35820 [Saccharopolyspora elongata]